MPSRPVGGKGEAVGVIWHRAGGRGRIRRAPSRLFELPVDELEDHEVLLRIVNDGLQQKYQDALVVAFAQKGVKPSKCMSLPRKPLRAAFDSEPW